MKSKEKIIDKFTTELMKFVESLAKKYGCEKPEIHLGEQRLIALKSDLNFKDSESEPIEMMILLANNISDKIEREIGMGFPTDKNDEETEYEGE